LENGESIELIRLGEGFVLIVKEDEEGTVTLSKYSINLPR